MLSYQIHRDNYPIRGRHDSSRYPILSNYLDSHHCQYRQRLLVYLGTYLEELRHQKNCRHSHRRQNQPIVLGRLAICLHHPQYSTL